MLKETEDYVYHLVKGSKVTKPKQRRKRSNLEKRMAEVLEPAGFTYETDRVDYVTHRTYTPDFSMGKFQIEVKGWFRVGDQMKYRAIKSSMDEQGLVLVFLLQSKDALCRKDTKITMGEWCTKYDIPCFEDPYELLEWVEGEGE